MPETDWRQPGPAMARRHAKVRTARAIRGTFRAFGAAGSLLRELIGGIPAAFERDEDDR